MEHDGHAPPGWLEAIERSEADVAAGRTVPYEMIERELLDAIAELENRAAAARRRAEPRKA